MAVRIKSSYYINGKKYTLAKLVKIDEHFTTNNNVYLPYLQKLLGKVVVIEKSVNGFLITIPDNTKDDYHNKKLLASKVLFTDIKVRTGEYLEFLSKKEIEAWRKENEKTVVQKLEELEALF
jgi:hypothetical protein